MGRRVETVVGLSNVVGGCNGCTEHDGPAKHYRVTAVRLLGCEFRVCDECRRHLEAFLRRPGRIVVGCPDCCDCEDHYPERCADSLRGGKPPTKSDLVSTKLVGNQCDGCLAGRPLDGNGNHRMGDGDYADLMACQRHRYQGDPPKEGA